MYNIEEPWFVPFPELVLREKIHLKFLCYVFLFVFGFF